MNKKKQSDITIHGSCVSRDVFNFDKTNEIKLGQYFARQSFISAVNTPFFGKIDINLSSPFQRRMVKSDLQKDLFKKLSVDKSNYLLIDFMDERLALFKYNGSFFTFSDELRDSKFLENLDVEFLNKININDFIWKDAMNFYVDQLLEIYDEHEIIIHEAYLVDSYITKNGEKKSFPTENLNYNKKVNKMLRSYYKHLKQKLPNAYVIFILEKGYCSCEDHLWGKSPMHYEDQYYKDVLKILKKIIFENKDIANSKLKNNKPYSYNSLMDLKAIKSENISLKLENNLLRKELETKKYRIAELQTIGGYLKYKIKNITNRSKKRMDSPYQSIKNMYMNYIKKIDNLRS